MKSDSIYKHEFLIKNGILLTQNNSRDIYNQGLVHVKNGVILYAGPEKSYLTEPGLKIIDAGGGIIMPGLINTHTHMGMSLFRTLADDRADRLRKVLIPLEKELLTPELVYLASCHSLTEMIMGGTTMLADMYYYENEVARAVQDSGIRALLAETVMHESTPDAQDFRETLVKTEMLVDEYRNHPLIDIGIAPHAPYSVEENELIQIALFSEKHNLPVMSHLSEMTFEIEKIWEKAGITPVEYYNRCGLLNERFLAAHCLLAEPDDLFLLKERNCGIAHNMVANIKSGKGIAPVPEMAAMQMRTGLGTDGPMSGNRQDILTQLGYVSKVQKGFHKNPLLLPPFKVVEMATIGGARALHKEHITGSLETGKRADIIIISTDSPAMYPIHDIYSALVYCAGPSDVQTVIVDGRLLMKERKLLTLDCLEIKKQSQSHVEKIQKKFC